MKLVGCMAVRNEDWILNLSARVALEWCDELVILLHECVDGSAGIAADVSREHPGRVLVTEVTGDWQEMQHRQKMLEHARSLGASHIAIIDADEVMTANLVGNARSAALSLKEGQILQMPLFNLRNGTSEYHSDGVWSNRTVSVAFHDHPRLSWSGDQFHAREPQGAPLSGIVSSDRNGGILHFWGASEARLIAKHALYKMTETLRWPEKPRYQIDDLYNLAFFGRGETAPVPKAWMAGYEPLSSVDIDHEPWQAKECARLLGIYGADRFDGLDLFGVCQ